MDGAPHQRFPQGLRNVGLRHRLFSGSAGQGKITSRALSGKHCVGSTVSNLIGSKLSNLKTNIIDLRGGVVTARPTPILDKADNLIKPKADAQVGHYEWSHSTDASSITLHHLKRSADMRCEVDLVDDQ